MIAERVAAKLPDALTGGTFMGLYDAPLLLVNKDSVPAETSSFIQALDSQEPCYVFGGPNSIEESVRLEIYDQLKHQLQQPALLTAALPRPLPRVKV